MNNSQRIDLLDVLKGLAIVLVVIGHTNTGSIIHNFIYGFHLFAFVFASGVLYKRRCSFREFFEKDIKPVLFMFLFFAVLYQLFAYGYSYLVNGADSVLPFGAYLKNAVLALLLGNPNMTGSTFGAAWYLMMYITLRLMYYLLDKVENQKLLTLLCLVLSVVGIFLLNGWADAPYYIASAFSCMIFFQLGRISREQVKKAEEAGWLSVLLLLFGAGGIYALTTFFTGGINVGTNIYPVPLVVITDGILGIAMLIGISVIAEKMKPVKDVFSYLGRNSLSIMGWHSSVKILLQYALLQLGVGNILIKFMVVIVGTLLVCVPLNGITNKMLATMKRKPKKKMN